MRAGRFRVVGWLTVLGLGGAPLSCGAFSNGLGPTEAPTDAASEAPADAASDTTIVAPDAEAGPPFCVTDKTGFFCDDFEAVPYIFADNWLSSSANGAFVLPEARSGAPSGSQVLHIHVPAGGVSSATALARTAAVPWVNTRGLIVEMALFVSGESRSDKTLVTLADPKTHIVYVQTTKRGVFAATSSGPAFTRPVLLPFARDSWHVLTFTTAPADAGLGPVTLSVDGVLVTAFSADGEFGGGGSLTLGASNGQGTVFGTVTDVYFDNIRVSPAP